jgi:transposase
MLPKEKTMELLEAYDLTKSFRAAGQLTGVDHHTVANAVTARACGEDTEDLAARPRVADAFSEKIEEWIERSGGKVRADVVHQKLVAMGYEGSERTTRRVVSSLKANRSNQSHRIYKPWITEPGMWLQYDFGAGPVIDGVKVILFCAWLAWSRFRVIIPLGDRSLPSVIYALDKTFRAIGGAPTYVLTDNEKTVTDYHLCGIAVRNEAAVAVSRYYGISLCTCIPFDPESKGGSESTVKIAKADLVPTEYNLLDEYSTFSELELACAEVQESFNNRLHSVTRRVPQEMLEEERKHLHPIPDVAYTAAFGESRSVGWSSTVSFRGARYSVPHTLAGARVWVRVTSGEVVMIAGEGSDAREVARHLQVGPGQASIDDAHYPKRCDPINRQPRATKPSEAQFLALGEGAKLYVTEAASCGARRIERRMAEAVTLAALHGGPAVDGALGIAAIAGRFLDGDLESILVHASGALSGPLVPPAEHSLAAGTQMWSSVGDSTEGLDRDESI